MLKTLAGHTVSVLFLCGTFLVAGCGGYHLQGKVIAGEENAVIVVEPNDERLNSLGLEQVAIEVTLDPTTLNPLDAGSGYTGLDGRFDIPVEQLGAGFLEYELGILCRKQGFSTVWQTMDMPSGNKRLLIIMTPGRDTYRPKENIIEETLRMAPK